VCVFVYVCVCVCVCVCVFSIGWVNRRKHDWLVMCFETLQKDTIV
jgi:hypothetical protein